MSDQGMPGSGRTKRLKEATREAHEGLDKAIMAYDPFADRAAYARFVAMQYRLHHAVEPFYRDAGLARLLPGLEARSRLHRVRCDLADLGAGTPEVSEEPRISEMLTQTLAQARAGAATAGEARARGLGWLYVVEGSNLGAAFLLKAAAGLGLSAEFGARHLAGDPDGRGLHWRTFTAALDAIELDDREEALLMESARDAFAHVRRLADEAFAAGR